MRHGSPVDLYLKEPTVDTTTPSGRVLFQAIGMFAEFERAQARKRVQVGVERARKAGKHFGRPKIDPDIGELVNLRADRFPRDRWREVEGRPFAGYQPWPSLFIPAEPDFSAL